MAQNITIAGATYHDVTAVSLKNTDGVDVIYSEQSGAAPAKSDVNFYDYDGTLVAAYTLAQAQALSALPSAPSHAGLTFDGWNYTLAQVNGLTGKTDIGAMYVTSDGKTRLNITIAALGRMTVPLYISQTVANGVTIDWGDGSATQTLSGTGNVNTTHAYSAIGDYTITLTVANGCVLGLGSGTSSYCVMGSTGNNGHVYSNMLQSVYIGGRTTSIGSYAFQYCYSLASITMPSSVTSIGSSAFQYCYSLASITIPSSVTSIGGSAFHNCYSLGSITIPSGVTSINGAAFANCSSLGSITISSGVTNISSQVFQNCFSLTSITIPSSATLINTSAFVYCYGVAYYDFSAFTLVPTLSATNAFTGIATDCQIRVPAALVDSWKAATNWATYASYIVGV